MRFLRWQLLAAALISYIVVVALGYYLLLEPRPSTLIAIEVSLTSLLGIGPRPLALDQQSNVALWFDIGVLLLGFLLRLMAVAAVAVIFVCRAQVKTVAGNRAQSLDLMEMALRKRRN